jgi:hypothetical protein
MGWLSGHESQLRDNDRDIQAPGWGSTWGKESG